MRLLKCFYQTVFYISGTFTYFLDCTNKNRSFLWDLCNNRIIIINTNFFIFSGKSLMEDKNVYKMGSQNPDLLWNSICERRKVPVMCLQIWGSPLSSPRIKLAQTSRHVIKWFQVAGLIQLFLFTTTLTLALCENKPIPARRCFIFSHAIITTFIIKASEQIEVL